MTKRNEFTFPNTASGKFTFYAVVTMILALFLLFTFIGLEFLAIGLTMVFGEGLIAAFAYLFLVVYFFFFAWNKVVNQVAAKAFEIGSKAAFAVSNFFNGATFA